MHYYQKHSFFPVIIILLTVSLAGFMFFVLRGSSTQTSAMQEPKPVNEEDYREGVSITLQTFEEQFVASQDNAQKRLATQNALSTLLELRVPVEYKELHLQLAIAWNQIQMALQNDSEDELDIPLKTIEQLKITYPWLIQ
ncbi:MAG: hypothetical protein UT30_C0001G0085 [Candidatus Uhrbacteria bacterium GW2011_GWF2_39_13]|uniref:Uncharacterized protein n=1 Tax=Candidatus Uhrbacteria bacterium GW2011_GWF2_39_13 TaxID=1618995 RepID=A0A0G0MXD4_9BACT|nr:MAG: hypothetical protein UT30_C0001G0085 [Candidatus Uhrbacteria bacterium GW2011_GWF2_39_13]HAU66412.1 hypothetical protein [Candidatus Uhrbacteria bacterium]